MIRQIAAPKGAVLLVGLCMGFCWPLGAAATAQATSSVPYQTLHRGITPWNGARQVLVPSVRRSAFATVQPVQVTAVKAHIRVVGNAARTTLEVELFNPSGLRAEAELLLPVPDRAAISGFFFEGSNQGATAELLPAWEAREMYDAIVARLRDPALLEFAGRAAVRSSVFPVPAQGTQKVRLIYDELLKDQGGRLDYELPRTAALSSDVPWSFQVEVVSPDGLATVYSPSHRLTQTAHSKLSVSLQVGQSASDQPGSFLMSILPAQDGLSASVLACPELDGSGGTWLLVASLGTGAIDNETIPREVTLVLDRSGSMAGEKFEQAREAARQVLEGLRPGERFRLVDYSDQVAAFSAAPVPKNAETLAAARAYLDGLVTGGGTNIGAALVEALRPAPTDDSLGLVLFLTDGRPTVGETSESGLGAMLAKANGNGHRIFPFGVGNDVNSPLLDSLALTTRGKATYVRPEQDVEIAVGDVFRRLKGPRLADLKIEVIDAKGAVDMATVRDLLPQNLPDLFEGDQLVLLGRYTAARDVTFRISGRAASGPKTYRVKASFSSGTQRNDFVPRLWATRRIAVLMDSIRQLTGDGVSAEVASADPRTKEFADEILFLSTKYGVLSEYTAFLALEGTDLGSWSDLAAQTQANLVNLNTQHRWGATAVNNGWNFQEEFGAQQVDARQTYWNAMGERVAIGNNRQVAGGLALQRGAAWIDGELVRGNESGELPEADVEITLGSKAHQRLVDELVTDRRVGLAALPGEVLFRHRGKVVRLRNDTSAASEDGQVDPQESETSPPDLESSDLSVHLHG